MIVVSSVVAAVAGRFCLSRFFFSACSAADLLGGAGECQHLAKFPSNTGKDDGDEILEDRFPKRMMF